MSAVKIGSDEKSIDARVQKNRKSIIELENLLNKTIREPETFLGDESLLSALKSQNALAKYENASLDISASSINTMKRTAEACFEDGFNRIDQLRQAANHVLVLHIKNMNKNAPPTKAAMYEEIKNLENLLNEVRKDCWHLSKALSKALSIGRVYAERTGDAAVIENCVNEQQTILKVFKLCNHTGMNSPTDPYA